MHIKPKTSRGEIITQGHYSLIADGVVTAMRYILENNPAKLTEAHSFMFDLALAANERNDFQLLDSLLTAQTDAIGDILAGGSIAERLTLEAHS